MSEELKYGAFGLPEHEVRQALEAELELAMRAEGDLPAPTARSIAHSVARILELDHRRMLDQLEQAGIRVPEDA